MCDSSFPSNTAFIFLEALKNQFIQTFTLSEIEKAISYGLNDSFKSSIKFSLKCPKNC